MFYVMTVCGEVRNVAFSDFKLLLGYAPIWEERAIAPEIAPEPTKKAPAPMQSAVHWALLGLVIERPSYGYELAHRFEHAYDGMLRLSGISYVYTALDMLQRRGMIEEIAGTRAGRQPKPRYRSYRRGSAQLSGQIDGADSGRPTSLASIRPPVGGLCA